MRVIRLPRSEAPVLDLSTGWSHVYLAKVSSKGRYAHRRKRKRLAELGRLEVSIARSWEELEPAWTKHFTSTPCAGRVDRTAQCSGHR